MIAGSHELYFSIALQYFISGRFSIYARLSPVAGNLLHHAIEMALKGHLSRSLNKNELIKHGHKLPTLWQNFKDNLSSIDLSKHDETIACLDKFEIIRYPEHIVENGAQIIISSDGAQKQSKRHKLSSKAPQYDLYLPDIDELFHAIFTNSRINMSFFEGSLNLLATEYLRKLDTNMVTT